MGINAITCKGSYTETGKTGFGEGVRTSSDFDGTDILKGAAILTLMAVGTFAAGCVGKDESPNFEQHQYRFNKFGDTKTVHDEATNKTYEFEFDGLMERRVYVSSYQVAHFNVYDVDAQGKTRIGDIELASHGSGQNDITMPGTRIDLGVEMGKGYVDLKVTER